MVVNASTEVKNERPTITESMDDDRKLKTSFDTPWLLLKLCGINILLKLCGTTYH